MNNTEVIAGLVKDIESISKTTISIMDTIQILVDTNDLLLRRIARLEQQASERGWILRDEPQRTM